MLAGRGRPRKACSTCRDHKIRCTGEIPICNRCMRLGHPCSYSPVLLHKPRGARRAAGTAESLAPSSTNPGGIRQFPPETALTERLNTSFLLNHLTEPRYAGIPKSIVLVLADAFYRNVYNASLLFQKALFFDSLNTAGVREHIVLSVCALAANFFREPDGRAPFNEHGLTTEWAKQAGKLVLEAAEDFQEDSLVTFSNLALYWHSQGSWRTAYLYKSNATHLLYILGFGSTTLRVENSLQVEIRRRRFWASYLIHCHASEDLSHFRPIAESNSLPLPWTEDDFAAGTSESPMTTLQTAESHGSIFSELVKILTYWSKTVSLIKPSDAELGRQIPDIYALDAKISQWWQSLPSIFKLTAAEMSKSTATQLPNVLLLNIAYHQSLCALHASIVPLFCWSAGKETDKWSFARKPSAQNAYEHACEISALVKAAMEVTSLASLPSFIAYAAYCGCAVLIPFMWCVNATVRAAAYKHIQTNLRLIQGMGEYWKLAALLHLFVHRLYKIHQEEPPILDDEPQYTKVEQLTSFKGDAVRARSSILEFNGLLHSKESGLVRPGEIDEGMTKRPHSSNQLQQQNQPQSSPTGSSRHGQSRHQPESEQLARHFDDVMTPDRVFPAPRDPGNPFDIQMESFDIFQPLIDPEMMEFYNDGVTDLSRPDSSDLVNLNYLDIESWDGIGDLSELDVPLCPSRVFGEVEGLG